MAIYGSGVGVGYTSGGDVIQQLVFLELEVYPICRFGIKRDLIVAPFKRCSLARVLASESLRLHQMLRPLPNRRQGDYLTVGAAVA